MLASYLYCFFDDQKMAMAENVTDLTIINIQVKFIMVIILKIDQK